MNIHCPACHQLMATHQHMAGQTVSCPHCSQAIQVPLATPVAPMAPGPPAATPVTPFAPGPPAPTPVMPIPPGPPAATPVTPFAPGPPAPTPVAPLSPAPGPGGATRVTPIATNPFPIATDRPTRRRSSSRRSTRRTTRNSRPAEAGNDSNNRLLGICGSLVLFVGVFCPFFSVGSLTMNYFRGGTGDGVIVLILAVVSFICILAGALKALWFTGVGSMGVILFTVIHYQVTVSESRMASAFISIDWGCPLLFVGAALVIAAAAIPTTSRQ